MTAQANTSPIGGWGRWVALGVLAATAWAAPSAASWLLSDTGWHAGESMPTLIDAYVHLFEPELIDGSGLSGRAFGTLTVGVAVLAAVIVAAVGWKIARRRSSAARGLASGAELDRFSARAIVERSETILGARDRDPQRAGFRVGVERWSRRPVWLPKESTLLVLAPPRSGKTSGTVAPAVAEHHGPVVATGVREDIMSWTYPWRAAAGGPLWLCEPMRDDGPLPAGVQLVRWSPLVGCRDLVTARLRAEALFAALPKAGSNDEFWRTAGQALLAGYLMAAAWADRRIGEVVSWLDQDTDLTPAELLENAARGLDGGDDVELERATLRSTAAQLRAAIGQDPRYRAGVTGQALQAVEPFRLPAVWRMCNVDVADSFDPDRFLAGSGTVWMLGSEAHQRQAAGVITALTASIVEHARARARRCGGRLRPPLLLALDEAVNVAPIPKLDQLLSTGGGSGIQTIVVLQSMAAARNTWGKEMGDALLDFNNAKLVLGGLSDAQDLQDLSTLLGQRDERTVQASQRGQSGVFTPNDYSYSWRQVPVMRPDEIRQLDSERRGHALLIARSARGILLVQDRIFHRSPPAAHAGAAGQVPAGSGGLSRRRDRRGLPTMAGWRRT